MRVARLHSRIFARVQRRHTACALLALTLMVCVAVSPAYADVGEELILRCTHGQSLSGYSQRDYRKALEELSATAEEYSPCAAQIRAAQLAAAAGGGRSGGPGGSAPAAAPVPTSPAQQRAITRAQSAPPAPVKLGGGPVVSPGVVHVNVASAFSALPSPVLALLAFLLVGLLTIAAGALRRRVGGRAD